METMPILRTDALLNWPEFEARVEREEDPRRRALLRFLAAQSLYAVSNSESDLTLDMKFLDGLADRLLDRHKYLIGILQGEIGESDW